MMSKHTPLRKLWDEFNSVLHKATFQLSGIDDYDQDEYKKLYDKAQVLGQQLQDGINSYEAIKEAGDGLAEALMLALDKQHDYDQFCHVCDMHTPGHAIDCAAVMALANWKAVSGG